MNKVNWTYTTSTYIAYSNGRLQIGSKNNPQTTDWSISTPVSSFGSNVKITNVNFTGYTTNQGATYSLEVGNEVLSSGNLTTSYDTYEAKNINVQTGEIKITLKGTSSSAALYIKDINVVYEILSDPAPETYNVNVNRSLSGGIISASATSATEGSEITLTATPETGYEFGAWSVTNASTNENITVTNNKFTMPAANVNVSATFNTVGGGSKDEYTHDVLTNADLAATGTTYTNFSNVKKNTAVYGGQSAKNNGIQLRSTNPAGIVSTTSGGNIKTITVTWNSNTASGRTIDVYGSNTAYASAADLYDNSKQGTKLGSIVMGTSTSITVTGDYAFVGIRSNNGALNIEKIDFAWDEVGTTPLVTLTTMDEIYAKAQEVNGTETDVKVTLNNWVVSGVNGSNAYVTDGTKGFIIYKSGHNFVAGDVLSGTVSAKIKYFNGAAEFTTITSTTDGLTVTKGGSVTEQNIAIANLTGVNTGALLAYSNLTYHLNGTNAEFSDGENVIVAYKGIMRDLPELIEDKAYDVKGVFLMFGTKKEILPRSEADIVLKEEPVVNTYEINWSVNGNIVKTETYDEGTTVTPPTVDAIEGKVFTGWVTTSTVDADATPSYVTLSTATADATYYAVFATQSGGSYQSNEITYNTENIPTSYAASADVVLNGATFNVTQMYKNGEKMQWRAAGNSNGTGTMYNKTAFNCIQSIAITYTDNDNNKNFSVKVGASEKPTNGNEITATKDGDSNTYIYDCSSLAPSYFVLTNGTGVGYLTSIVITYGDGNAYSDFCTIVEIGELPKYTVTFDAQAGSCDTESLTESISGKGITLPSATCYDEEWTFAGWATAACNETTTAPTLYKAGTTYKPTTDITLYAVYMTGVTEGETAFNRVTDISELTNGKRVVVVSNATDRVLTLTGSDTHTQENLTSITESEGKYIWTLGLDNDIYTLTDETSGHRILSFQSTPNPGNNQTGISKWQTSGGYKKEWKISASEVENCWIITNTAEANQGGYAALYLTNPTGSWGALNLQTTSANKDEFAMRIYAEGPSISATYNSNPIEYFNLTISSAGYATYYNAFAYKMPENVVGKIMVYEDGVVKSKLVYEAGDVVPVETPLLLKGTPDTYTLVETTEEATKSAEGNLLRGSHVSETTTGGSEQAKYYKFSNGDNGYGWYYGSKDNTNGAAFTNGAHKAYLVVEPDQSMSTRFIAIDSEGVLTDIEGINVDDTNGNVYDLQGRRVQRAGNGIYIKNGKKVIF